MGTWIRVWRAAGLLVIFAYMGVAGFDGGTPHIESLAAGLALLLWFSIGMLLPDLYRQLGIKHRWTAIYMGSGWFLWVVMTQLHPFGYVLLLLFFSQIHIFYAPPISYAINALLTLMVVFEITLLGGATLIALIIAGLWVLFGVAIGLFIEGIIRQSDERRQLIEALQAARDSLAQSERRAGMMEERHRLANEIHDTLAQGFTSVVMHLEAVSGKLPDGGAHVHIDAAKETARSSLAEARRFIWALRPEILEAQALGDGIRQLIMDWARNQRIEVEFQVTGIPVDLRPEYDVALLRITQEALANIAKHAKATHVAVTLSYLHDMVVLDVQDNGKGFTQQPVLPTLNGGFGLIGMRERVERLGGTLLIEGIPGAGTTLVIELPVTTEEKSIADE